MNPADEFIDQSLWHGSLDRAEAIKASTPDLANRSIYAASVLGDDAAVRRFLALDPESATAAGGPRNWDALTYLSFSKYLRRDGSDATGFLSAARALLDAGASANTGFWDGNHKPRPEWESALYGAAGVAHDAGLTKLLLEHGADPNDAEVPYHSPETRDNRALAVLLNSGKLTDDSLTTMLLRKSDWHDLDGIKMVLDAGADPNRRGPWPNLVLHHAIWSDNWHGIVELLLDRGADPYLPPLERTSLSRPQRGNNAPEMAAWNGRSDLLEVFERRGIELRLDGLAKLLAAASRSGDEDVAMVAGEHAEWVRELATVPDVLVAFARVGNTDGVRHLLDLGVPIESTMPEDSGYLGLASGSTALHAASWRGEHDTVKLLVARDANVNAKDRMGRTPLQLAVQACVDSYWVDRASTESIEALLRAGASVEGVRYPSGYAAGDALLKQYGAHVPT